MTFQSAGSRPTARWKKGWVRDPLKPCEGSREPHTHFSISRNRLARRVVLHEPCRPTPRVFGWSARATKSQVQVGTLIGRVRHVPTGWKN